MKISYDPAKCLRNIEERGLSFDNVLDLDWTKALIKEDQRHDYGERRYATLAPIEGRLHVLIFTRRGEAIHVISLRKANRREVNHYEQATRF